MKRLLLILMIPVLLFSCQEEDDSKPLTPEQAKEVLKETQLQLSDDLSSVLDAEGIASIQKLSVLFNSGGFEKSSLKGTSLKTRELSQDIFRIFVPATKLQRQKVQENPFVFEDFTGVYEYNFSTQEFEKKKTSDEIVLLFPTDGATTMDAALVFSDLGFIIPESDRESLIGILPTNIVASLTVEGEKQAMVDLHVIYNENYEPLQLNLELFVNPITFDVEISNSNENNATLSSSLTFNEHEVLALNLSAQKNNEDFVKSINGSLKYWDIVVQGSFFNPETMTTDPQSLNEVYDLAVFENQQKIGDVAFFPDTNYPDEEIAYLVFSDGTKIKISEVMEDIEIL